MLINTDTHRQNTPVFRPVKRVGDMSNYSFDWKKEIDDPSSKVWRLSVASNQHSIAYLSIFIATNFVEINLIERENAQKRPEFINIGKTLIGFACLQSANKGFDGVVSFTAKDQLLGWYRTNVLAQRIGNSNRMVILEKQADNLIKNYIP